MEFRIITKDKTVFTLPKEVLMNYSDLFRVKFSGMFKDSKDESSEYDAVTSEAFQPIFDWLTERETIFTIFATIAVSDLEASLVAADFFRFEEYELEMKKLMMERWHEGRKPLEMLQCAKKHNPDKHESLELSCVRLAYDILTGKVRYLLKTSYKIVLYAAPNLFKISQEGNIIEDFDTTYRVGKWLVKNHALTADRVYSLLKKLRLDINPGLVTYVDAFSEDEKRMLKVIVECKDRILRERREKITRLLEQVYIRATSEISDYSLLVCSFVTNLWFWQTRCIELSYVYATHFVKKNLYVFLNKSLVMFNLDSMTNAVVVFQNNSYALENREIFYTSDRPDSVLTCNDDISIYFVPNVSCGYILQYNTIRKSFDKIPDKYSEIDMRTWDVVVHDRKLYLACLNTKKSSKTIQVYKLDPVTQDYILLCQKKNLRGMPRKNYNPHICLGVLGNVIYVFCFGSRPTFYFEIDLTDSSHTDLRIYGNGYYDRLRTVRPPYIFPKDDGFLMTAIVQKFEERTILIGYLKPRENVFELLGCLPVMPTFNRLSILKMYNMLAA